MEALFAPPAHQRPIFISYGWGPAVGGSHPLQDKTLRLVARAVREYTGGEIWVDTERMGTAAQGRSGLDDAMAAGIGFTVALFVTGLAFDEPGYTDQAKVGILMASFVAAVLSAFVLRIAASRASARELEIEAAENAEMFEQRPLVAD